MFLNWGADAARSNVAKYERQTDRAELKYIIRSINTASHKGYMGIRWRGKISKANIYTLKKYGYEIIHITNYAYEINW